MTADINAECPAAAAKTVQGSCGCGAPETDTDGDGTANCVDGCAFDIDKTQPGICGCGAADADKDGDGVADCSDLCPENPTKSAGGACGCGVSDTDSDGDTLPDCMDSCPLDKSKTVPGACGCGIPDQDLDANGILDCFAARELALRAEEASRLVAGLKRTSKKASIARIKQGIDARLAEMNAILAADSAAIQLAGAEAQLKKMLQDFAARVKKAYRVKSRSFARNKSGAVKGLSAIKAALGAAARQ